MTVDTLLMITPQTEEALNRLLAVEREINPLARLDPDDSLIEGLARYAPALLVVELAVAGGDSSTGSRERGKVGRGRGEGSHSSPRRDGPATGPKRAERLPFQLELHCIPLHVVSLPFLRPSLRLPILRRSH